MPLLAAAAAVAPPLSSFHSLSLSSRGLRVPSPCEARPRAPLRRGDLAIRMGGGPRTFPGGVSKWQWKRMQARKAKQLLKARLARERQLYEMRKRAELREAAAHLERPWDPDASDSAAAAAAAPNLLSVAADDQMKALADRFHRPGGVDLWNDRDGPRVFAAPDTGRASARFFPKGSVHSVQPYGLVNGGLESTLAARGNPSDATDRSHRHRLQGVRENAAKKEMRGVGGDREPAVEYIERGGVWEPVSNLDGGDDDDSSDGGWNDDIVTSDLEDMGDVDLRPEQRAMVGRDRRKDNVARWEATTSVAIGSDGVRDQRGNGFSLEPEGTSEYHLGQSWQERNSGSRGKRPAGRRKALNTDGGSAIGKDRVVGGSSFSDSEVTRNGFEPKWRSTTRGRTTNDVRRWNPPNEGGRNVPRKGWTDDEFGSNSDSGMDHKLMPKWKTQNRLNRSENGRDRPELKYMANTNNGERTRRYMRGSDGEGRRDRFVNRFASDLEEPEWKPRRKSGAGNDGDGRRDRFVNRFASDLEEPKWKPGRKSGARMNIGNREYIDDMNGRFRRGSDGDGMNGRFRRGSNGAARLLDAMDSNREIGSEDDSYRMSRNGGQRRGDGYSLRPTSELHNSRRLRESNEM
ncbi:hypothetical protein OsJ_07169 [Oryza sativa Japonica Group]|uniref:Uncharacterized protein n=1 Tax=Oryza sativa subsp. japonica TaxID=39947 RepID=A3A836_ORYSJ|nr:hypothetical protein OsJ_07169 [Oryza sativa Japonica Group]